MFSARLFGDLIQECGLPEPNYDAEIAPGWTALVLFAEAQAAIVAGEPPAVSGGWRIVACDPADEASRRSAVGALAAMLAYAAGDGAVAPHAAGIPDRSGPVAITLTEVQRAAVLHPDGKAAWILAGAGTGKTRVIVERFHHLVDRGARPDRILVLTFSRDAAGHLRDAIVTRLAAGARLWISTFHSFCLKLMQAEGMGERRLLHEPESRQILRTLQGARPWQWYGGVRSSQFEEEAFAFIGMAKDQLLMPDQVAAYAAHRQNARLADLAEAYRLFQQELDTQQAADFSDYICRAVEMLQQNSEALSRWQQQFDHVLVDEFQDTNLAQFRLLKLLVEPHGNLMVVGDDDQAIYRFRGADDRFIVTFNARFPAVEKYRIEENFRCPEPVLQAANRLIQHNVGRVEKKLYTTTRTEGFPPVRHWLAQSERDEAEAVAGEIARQIRSDRRPSEFAILCRSLRRSAGEFTRALAERSIPYRLVGEERVHPAVAQTLALLRLLQRDDEGDLLHVLSAMLPPEELYEAIRSRSVARTAAAQEVVAALESWRDLPLPDLVYQALKFLGHLRLSLQLSVADVDRLTAVRTLQERAQTCGTLDQLLGVSSVSQPVPGDAVSIMTVHGAKGLEFPVVFMVHLAEDIFPVALQPAPVFHAAESVRQWVDGEAGHEPTAVERITMHLREERRLAYVALTRAREELILTRSLQYGGNPAQPSRFLGEMGAPDPESVTSEADPLPAARDYLLKALAGARAPVAAELASAAETLLNPAAVPLRRQAEPAPFTGTESLQLSPTALEAYRTCPRRYYYAQVLRMPDEDSIHSAFGSALHAVLERWGRARMQGEFPAWSDMDNWWEGALTPDAFESGGQFAQMLERGRIFLRRYYDWACNQDFKVVAVEQGFTMPYTDRQGRRHSIRGRLDLIVERADGLEIIDYKSGHRKGSTEVNKRETKGSLNNASRKLQLGVYYLAHIGQTPRPNVRVAYHFLRHPDDKPPVHLVSEFDLNKEQVISCTHTAESLQQIRTDMDDLIDLILANRFERTTDLSKCKFCPYRETCEVTPRDWF